MKLGDPVSLKAGTNHHLRLREGKIVDSYRTFHCPKCHDACQRWKVKRGTAVEAWFCESELEEAVGR